MMPLPETIGVRLSSEDAGAISLTRVVTQEMSFRDLFATMVAVTGKDAARILRILHAGTLLDGGTRYRWSGLDLSGEEIGELLEGFPNPDPGRAFSERDAFAVTLRDSAGRAIQLPREAAAKRRLLRRTSFWDAVVNLAKRGDPVYVTYSYRHRADVYRLELSGPEVAAIHGSTALLAHSTMARQLEKSVISSVEFLVRR